MVGRALFRLARRPAFHAAVRLVFAHASGLLPVRRVVDAPTALAFHHPRPSYPTHVLVVPKRAVPSLLELGDLDVLVDVARCAGDAVARLDLSAVDCALVVNGGRYQDVGQLHAHLVVGALDLQFPPPEGAVLLPLAGPCTVVVHPDPRGTTHFAVRAPGPLIANGQPCPDALRAAYAAAQELARANDLAPRGFAVVLTGPGLRTDCLHVVAGDRTAR